MYKFNTAKEEDLNLEDYGCNKNNTWTVVVRNLAGDIYPLCATKNPSEKIDDLRDFMALDLLENTFTEKEIEDFTMTDLRSMILFIDEDTGNELFGPEEIKKDMILRVVIDNKGIQNRRERMRSLDRLSSYQREITGTRGPCIIM